ncbi:MAG TPA: hypothetical protein VGO52_10325 [Hyphomonadaceae bacterium]|jgi:hypothetical protein|nr:hypothetical protein [Hyphomonadaceae bacterium]
MFVVVHNDVSDAIHLLLDEAGVDLLIARLQELKKDQTHTHLIAGRDYVFEPSPWGHKKVFGELTLDWAGD